MGFEMDALEALGVWLKVSEYSSPLSDPLN
jgi:hypothetical protein